MKDEKWPVLSRNFSLDGEWRLAHRSIENLDYAKRPSGNTIAANVPGDVHLDLMRHGDIDDPLIRDNAAKCAWIGEHEWWYEKSFELDLPTGAKHEIVFDGLCYVADVWLNDEHLGRHLNMHRSLTVDVTGKLKQSKKNLLVVRLLAFDDDALKVPVITGGPFERWSEGISNKEYCVKRGATHKALYSFGWDWTQGLSICGIWRGVRIESTLLLKIEDAFVMSQVDGHVRASFTCDSTLQEIKAAEIILTLREHDSGAEVGSQNQSIFIGPGRVEYALETLIKNPHLWWPAGLGGQFLYEAELSISVDTTLVATQKVRFGVRSFEVQEPMVSEDQAAFRFTVNGVYVFAKGTNWIPPDIIPARADDRRYEILLDQYVEAGFNYLRFWGGGIYERKRFYDLCDEKGILVFHDMMFSCVEVPDFDPVFVAEAVREVEYNIKRLRNHASIVIWCGANETDVIPRWIKKPRPNGGYYGRDLYHRVFAETISQLDPSRPYIPSDPCVGKNNCKGSILNPRHGTHHGNFDTNAFTTDDEIDRQGVPSFVNECYASSPNLPESMRKYLDDGELDWNNPVFKTHEIVTVQMFGNEKGLLSGHLYLHPMERFDDIPFQEKAAAFTTNHCLLVKRFTEALRLRRDRCGGVAFWMFNSAFTMADWSLTDYYCLPKPAFYQAKRSNRNLLPIIALYHDRIEFHMLNDFLSGCEGDFHCEIKTFGGKLVWTEHRRIKVEANTAGKHLTVWRKTLNDFDPTECYVAAKFKTDGEEAISNHRFFASPKILKILNTEIHISPVPGKPGTFTLSADGFVKNLRITPYSSEIRPDDNFFDLLPGMDKTVNFNQPVKAADIRLECDNHPERRLCVIQVIKPEVYEGQMPPFTWRCVVLNPTLRPQTYRVDINVPEGFFATHPVKVEVEAGQTFEIPFVISVDPFSVKLGSFPIEITIDDYTVYESGCVNQPALITKDGYLEMANPPDNGSKTEPWFLRRQTLCDRSATPLPLGTPSFDARGLSRRKLDLPPDTLPYTCEIWSSNYKVGDFYGGSMNTDTLWNALPKQPFKTADLRIFATRNYYWPELSREGYGFLLKAATKDEDIVWKCDTDVEALIFLHHDVENIYFNVFVRNMPFKQSFTGLEVYQSSCLEIVLGPAGSADFVDFSLALTSAGPQQFFRRGIKSGLAEKPCLKIYHRMEERLTSYHHAFSAKDFPGLLSGDPIKFAMVICGEKTDTRITLFNGVIVGAGTTKSASIALE